MEIWKDVDGYKNIYQVSNCGRIKSLTRKGRLTDRILKMSLNTQGYYQVCLSSINNKTFLVSRLVACAFIANPESKATVNHKNGITSDNELENLEWATQSENRYHAYRIGLQKVGTGKDNHLSKPVIQYSLNGKMLSEFESQTDASLVTGVYRKSISATCVGRYKTAGGFIWRFKN